ncbi:MAG: 7-cyano-7-deazaguanine synthase QueC [Acidobacteria bacterium]|nr:7-cyano-7-deazaguanine synthase QueC [Acidobacteriota bacterium]
MNDRDIDKVILSIEERFPDVKYGQLKVTHPSDDDGIWYFWIPGAERDEIHVENGFGQCPFLCETYRSSEQKITESIESTVELICQHLSTASNDNVPLAVCLVSGGMDSCVSAAIANRENALVAMLHISYGQITEERERLAFNYIAGFYNAFRVLDVSIEYLAKIGGSSLTDKAMAVTEADLGSKEIPTSYVPFRNANMLAIATSWAEVLGATIIYIGAVAEDSSGYPDCRPEFYAAFQQTINTGTKPDTHIEIRTPIIQLSKAEIVKKGIELNAPLHLTWSCYRSEDLACGTCDSCALRLRGFAQAGLTDPIAYKSL